MFSEGGSLVVVATRRRLLLALGAGALGSRLSFAQQGKIWRIGFLSTRSRDAAVELAPFLEGMRQLGYIEGKTVRYELRFGDGDYERLPALAAELVKLKPDVIVTLSTPSALAVQQATRTIPVVIGAIDPVGRKLVASLAKPGGNITGLSNLAEKTLDKQLDLLVQTLPKLSRVGLLINPRDEFSEAAHRSLKTQAERHALHLIPVHASTAEEIDTAFAAMKRERSQALIVIGSAFFVQRRNQLAQLAAGARLPAIYSRRGFVEAGGLMSYGRNPTELYLRASYYVDKILRGAKPGDLPVEEPTAIELVINPRVAKALGITFPTEVRMRANRVIE